MKRLHNPALECRVEVWADEAPEEPKLYRLKDVGGISDYIKEWASDGAVGCSIGEAPQSPDLVYMWAELKGLDEQTHPGEVGLKCGANTLDTNEGKLEFSSLFKGTALRSFTKDEIEQVYGILRDNVLKYSF
jgi:hypothetical protein